MDGVHLVGPVLLVLAVVQSLFGMGILVFGTPTLLLLGFDFAQVLGWLLPSSLAISLLQVAGGRHHAVAQTLPPLRPALVGVPLLATLALILLLQLKASIDLWIGLAMLSAAALRQSAWLKERFARLIRRHQGACLAAMGLVHGATNMGGALLALYAAATTADKAATRLLIARYYLLFGLLQLAVLALFQRAALAPAGLLLAPLAALCYGAVGNVLFRRAGALAYERAFTGFIAAYGAAVIGKAWL